MGTYCVGLKKYTANKNSSARKTKQNRLMLFQIGLFVERKNKLL